MQNASCHLARSVALKECSDYCCTYTDVYGLVLSQTDLESCQFQLGEFLGILGWRLQKMGVWGGSLLGMWCHRAHSSTFPFPLYSLGMSSRRLLSGQVKEAFPGNLQELLQEASLVVHTSQCLFPTWGKEESWTHPPPIKSICICMKVG